MKDHEAFLGKEKVSKLLLKFSIPCVISFMVNALYNIVDQIFIGRGIGYLANGATNIIFPLTMLCLGFALLFGDGAASFLSIKLGEGKKDEAAKGVATGSLMVIITSIIFCILILLFLPQILTIFGCTEALWDYATTYGSIIALGIPFFMIGITLNSIIRASGNPKFAMLSMVIGAVINTILDPILIFGFNTGVEGAAYATIFSQFVTFVINAWYISKLDFVTFNKEIFSLKWNYIRTVAGLGVSSLVNNISIVAVIAVTNNLLAKYGSVSKFGPDIPITVIGIVMKIAMILNGIILGISIGSQPIVGYNYGAKKYNRVKEALKLVLICCSIVGAISFTLFQTIPDKIIGIFGSGNELYIEFACLAFRIYLFFCFTYGIQMPAGIFFQSIGKSKISAFLSLSRQIIILIPLFFILGKEFGIMGILYAGAVADLLSVLIAIIFLFRETKSLGRKHRKQTEKENPLNVLKNFSGELFEVVANRSLIHQA